MVALCIEPCDALPDSQEGEVRLFHTEAALLRGFRDLVS